MYKKVYLEITNICNLSCSFCHKTKREKRLMTMEEFDLLTDKIKNVTRYLYFHLMGEPLLHPDISDFLKLSSGKGFFVTVATNGFLIEKRAKELLSAPLYKITFSLHSYEANESNISLEDYLKNIIDFCKQAEKKGTICVLRLWNEGGENTLNEQIISVLKDHFKFTESRKGYTLSEKIYLEFAGKFIWPDKNAPTQKVSFCMGLRDHIGVLCDGSVVPCCLDADGEITLGNLFNEDIDSIVNTPRAKAIYDGFSKRQCTEELCSRCEYATRFNRH